MKERSFSTHYVGMKVEPLSLHLSTTSDIHYNTWMGLSYRVHSTRLVVGAHGFERCQPDGGTLKRPPPGEAHATTD